MKLPVFAFALSLTGLFLSGCSDTIDSANLDTDEITAHIEFTARDSDPASQTDVRISLIGADDDQLMYEPKFVELSYEDDLTVYAKSREFHLHEDRVETGSSTKVYYLTVLPFADEETRLEVHFRRDYGDDAFSTSVRLTPPFDITTAQDQTFLLEEEVPITWTPGFDGFMVYRYELDCLDTHGSPQRIVGVRSLRDEGVLMFSLRAVARHNTDPSAFEYCDGTLKLTRARSGRVDSAFNPDSYIIARQIRELHLRFE